MMLSVLTAALALSASVHGHPETAEERKAQAAALRRIAAHSKRSMANCANSPAATALKERAIARRSAWADQLREQRGLMSHVQRRGQADLTKYLGVSHDETSKGYTAGTAADVLFASNATCILVPETIIGPYYVAGESFRKNLADGEKGVATHFEIQFVDIKTCEAIPDLIVDLWHANALGVYSAVTAAGQGGLKTNWGRGSQQTDKDGVVQFESIFPGHYVGRTNHFHIMTTDNARILPNKTFEGGTVSHIGQVYFDEALIAEVEKKDPYVQNQQPVTNNREDELTGDEASEDYDPFMKYVKLGDDVEDGLLLWIGVGIDQTANYDGQVSVASHWHPDGGADKSDAEGQQSGASSVLHGYGTLLHLLGGLLSLYILAC